MAPSYLIIPDAATDKDISKLQQNLSSAFDCANHASFAETQPVQTLRLELPDHLKQGISDWMKGLQFESSTELCAMLLRSPSPPPSSPPPISPLPTSSTHTTKAEKSALLSLPPEMRNRIYRAALVEGEISIAAGQRPRPEPALLYTRRRIRDEALAIYYKENCFDFHIKDYDADNSIQWQSSASQRHDAHLTWRINVSTNWPNLVRWLEAWDDGRVTGPTQGATAGSRKSSLTFSMWYTS